ncbi:MAG: SDR family NAD(P)-dependent oxidoreductase [Pseudomonadota bacterium]
MSISFEDQVVIVTGAGAGLGRSHALQFASRGAKVVVNDFGGASDGTGRSSEASKAVVAEIEAAGGEAIANGADVSDFEQVEAMAAQAIAKWGRIDVVVANAGILRDKSFPKMEMPDFRKVLDVHLMGTVHCAKAVWGQMREQNYGRLVFTTSSSGMYGNFGQSNYGAAKMGIVGLMNVLSHEGAKYDIHVNTISPTAMTRMTEGLLDEVTAKVLTPESVTPAVVYLASKDAPTKTILCAGGGAVARTFVHETDGVYFGDNLTAEAVMDQLEQISATEGQEALPDAFSQTRKYVEKAIAAKGD